MIKRDTLVNAAIEILELASHYKGAPHREMTLDGLVYGFLFARFGSISRQHQVRTKSGRPKRIDFRNGGTNPTLIEFVVRTEKHKTEAYGPNNRDELSKLERQTRAKARYLLILDVSSTPLQRDTLTASYAKVSRGRGRYPRSSVRVVYVHADNNFHFLWPTKAN